MKKVHEASIHSFLDSFREKGDLKSIKKAVLSIQSKYMPKDLMTDDESSMSDFEKKDSLSKANGSVFFKAADHIGKNSLSKMLEGEKEHTAYVLYRMPATYAAVNRALEHLKVSIPSFSPKTILDLGTGPGTALVAAFEQFPSLKRAVGLERSEEFVRLFHECFAFFRERRAEIRKVSLEDILPDERFDCVIASYSFGELSLEIQEKWFSWAQKNAKVFLLVEPGTPAGWETMLGIREKAVFCGATILSPCPHSGVCPMKKEGRTWCHESIRLPRSFIHRYMKEGSLGYEDEKFCHISILFDNTIETQVPPCRIVHSPKHRAGHTILQLCTKRATLEEHIVSRRYKDLFAQVKRVCWGDGFADVPADKEKDVQKKLQSGSLET